MSELRAGLERVAAGSGVEVGISVEELGRGSGGVGVDENMVFESASLIKVLILAELLRRVDEGSVSLGEPLGGSTAGLLAEAMISTSDNAATNLLIARLGFEDINALARDLGLEETSLSRKMLDFEARARGEDNFTSASDMTILLSLIWEGDLLFPASRKFALAALENQKLYRVRVNSSHLRASVRSRVVRSRVGKYDFTKRSVLTCSQTYEVITRTRY